MTRAANVHRRREQMKQVAHDCGFGDPDMEPLAGQGVRFMTERDGVSIEVSVQSRSRQGAWTSVRVPCEGAAVELSLRPELPGESIDKALGMTVDHDTGDDRFDQRFVIAAAPVEAARYVLSASVREGLLALLQTDQSPRVTLHAAWLEVSWEGEALPATVSRGVSTALGIRSGALEMHEGVPTSARGPFRAAEGALALVDPVRRADAALQIRRARGRAVAFLGTTAALALSAIAAAILSRFGVAVTHGLTGFVRQIL